MIYMFLSNNPSSGDINSSNLSCLQYFLVLSLKKINAEMSFLRVNDLLLVCIVQNHYADSPLYITKICFH